MYQRKGVPRHEFNEDGDYVALDTCALEQGDRLHVVSEMGKILMSTTFVLTEYEKGAMHDWHVDVHAEDDRVSLSHVHIDQSGGSFLDRSVLLKTGNELSLTHQEGDPRVMHLGRIVDMHIEFPPDRALGAVIQLPVQQEAIMGAAA